jgi:hypothetical protein
LTFLGINMYKVTYKEENHVLFKTFDTMKESLYFANKFAEGMILEIKLYCENKE